MKRVRILTGDYTGAIAICQIPAKGVYWVNFERKELKLDVKPEIIKDASILDVTRITYLEMTETFNIQSLTSRVENYMFENRRQPRIPTIDRRLRDLKELGAINYKVVDRDRGVYKKLPVAERAIQGKINYEVSVDTSQLTNSIREAFNRLGL